MKYDTLDPLLILTGSVARATSACIAITDELDVLSAALGMEIEDILACLGPAEPLVRSLIGVVESTTTYRETVAMYRDHWDRA